MILKGRNPPVFKELEQEEALQPCLSWVPVMPVHGYFAAGDTDVGFRPIDAEGRKIMKGIVFTEFLEMVEDKFSPETADKIIEASDLPSGGAYSSVGAYDHGEIVQLVVKLSEESGLAVPDLIRTFGEHLFGRFHEGYPHFFEGVDNAFDFLDSVEGHIHVEVLKLYPDAELPTLDTSFLGDNKMELIYRSARKFSDLAEGLIIGCAKHYGETLGVEREDLSGDGSEVRFTLTRE
jgi:hypothetical protein